MKTIDRNMAAEILKAMAHPVRLGVLEALAGGDMTATELQQQLDCGQSMMSQQLKILLAQKLVAFRRSGHVKIYSMCNRDFLKLFDCMSRHMEKFL